MLGIDLIYVSKRVSPEKWQVCRQASAWYRVALQWRHNDHDGVSNHQTRGCLLNRLFRRRSKKTSKLRITGLCAGNSPGPVNSPHKGPVTRKMFPFDDVIMGTASCQEVDYGSTKWCHDSRYVMVWHFFRHWSDTVVCLYRLNMENSFKSKYLTMVFDECKAFKCSVGNFVFFC